MTVRLRREKGALIDLDQKPPCLSLGMVPSHVEAVFIAGKLRKWRGGLLGVDTARVRQLVEDARAAVMRRANFRVELLG
jgi:5-methylthioadenosine/S-adenosylhomocysteine deaminase